jgi:hypothetical protein
MRRFILVTALVAVCCALYVAAAGRFEAIAAGSQADKGAFRTIQVRYERLLARAARGEPEAENELADAWDALLRSLGRPAHIPTETPPAYGSDSSDPVAAIQVIWRDPSGARLRAGPAGDNPKMLQITDADQSAREGLEKLGPIQLLVRLFLMWPGDYLRAHQAQRIAASGGLVTARDFANASLVMQHSTSFSGYELAHELAVCSLLLGDHGNGRRLVAYTYDRMLGSVGHLQRFATQYDSTGLLPTDVDGIDDDERLALGCPTLAQAKSQR